MKDEKRNALQYYGWPFLPADGLSFFTRILMTSDNPAQLSYKYCYLYSILVKLVRPLVPWVPVSKATPKLHLFAAVCGDERSKETLVARIASLTSVSTETVPGS